MKDSDSALAPYRMLDLTTERGYLCGKILSDLGAEVIKVEPPGGDPDRLLPPFYRDIPGPERGLFWMAYNAGKKSVTLDIRSADGQRALKELVDGTDFLVESFPVGYLDSLGLGYPALSKINPRLIMASISPFGQEGPFSRWKGPDIVPWAMSGYMWMSGEPGHSPLRISHVPQSYLHASAATASGLLLALRHRHLTGYGQYIDTSAQQCPVWMLTHTYAYWEIAGAKLGRGGAYRNFGSVFLRTVWPCKDGYIVFMFAGGAIGAKGQRRVGELTIQAGLGNEWLKNFDWDNWDANTARQEEVDTIADAFSRFFKTQTKADILKEALQSGNIMGPVYTLDEIMRNPQLEARGYWQPVVDDRLNTTILYPGAPVKLSETPWKVKGRAPGVGEHNRNVFTRALCERHIKPGAGRDGKRPLEGIRVLDFSTTILGPSVTRYLTDHGATVLKVESPGHPETSRISTPYAGGAPGLNRSGYFAVHNAGKLSISLDMANLQAREIARKLVRWADIVIETFTPGVMQRWGMAYEDLRKLKPDIIMASSSLLGQTGPHASLRGYGMVSAAMAGYFELTGWPDGEPIGPYSAYADFVGWNFLLVSILAALDYRDRTGKGQYLDQSHVESAAHFLAPAIFDYQLNGRVASRVGNRDGGAAPHGAFRCAGKDRWCAIAVTSDEEWISFSRVIGSPAWTTDMQFASLAGRKANEDELEKLVEGWTVNHPPEEVMTLMQQSGVPAGMVANAEDLFKDPQLGYRTHFAPLQHAEIGRYHISTSPFKLSRCDSTPRSAAPLMGEHNEYVLREILGLPDDEIARLIVEGVLG